MKKTYIAPNINVYKIKVNKLLLGSPEIQSSGSASEGSSDAPVNLSREFGFGDEE